MNRGNPKTIQRDRAPSVRIAIGQDLRPNRAGNAIPTVLSPANAKKRRVRAVGQPPRTHEVANRVDRNRHLRQNQRPKGKAKARWTSNHSASRASRKNQAKTKHPSSVVENGRMFRKTATSFVFRLSLIPHRPGGLAVSRFTSSFADCCFSKQLLREPSRWRPTPPAPSNSHPLT